MLAVLGKNSVLVSLLLAAASGLARADSACPSFVESPLEPGVFCRAFPLEQRPALGAPHARSLSAGVRALPGFLNPGAVFLAGGSLYVVNNGASLVSEVDIATPGQEAIIGTISTPVNPVDLAVVNGTLYVIDQQRDKLHYRPLAGGSWAFVQLPAAAPRWSYGNVIFPHASLGKMFVLHFWENTIHVVDLATKQIDTSITNVHHLPDRVRFASGGTRMLVLCVGLDAPSCTATGPHWELFDLASGYQKLLEVPVNGDCAETLAEQGGDVFVVRDSGVLSFDLTSGAPQGALGGLGLGRHAEHNGAALFVQDDTGAVLAVDPALSGVGLSYGLLANPQIWYPPLEEMAAAAAVDGRVFVANRNDGCLSIIDWPACFAYGSGCPGSGGSVPLLAGGGCPAAGQSFSLALSGGLGGAPAFLFLGTGTAFLPLAGECVFLLAPVQPPAAVIVLSGAGPGAGAFALDIPVPAAVPPGYKAALQVLIADPGAVPGYAASNALHLATQ
ncbi:MAG: hypothetical protein HY812_06600 [Planctomycetes bacterium]|nr:hypothetical protein [Planctomycetota bacterium]